MSDRAFLAALESCELPAQEFDHVAHIRAAYLYLCEHGFARGLEKMMKAIQRYAAHLGQAGKYNETITVAYMALIQQHIVERGHADEWAEFQRRNPELFAEDLLVQFYSATQLNSESARRTFVLPRRVPAAG